MSPLLFLVAALTAPGPLSAKLPDGNTLYLSYVSDDPETHSWRPNGTPGPAFKTSPSYLPVPQQPVKPGQLALDFTLQIKDSYSPSNVRTFRGLLWQPAVTQVTTVPPDAGFILNAMPVGKDLWQCPRVTMVPPGADTLSVDLKVSDAAWKTVSKARYRKGLKVAGDPIFHDVSSKHWGQTTEHPIPIDVPNRWKSQDWRVVGIYRDGLAGPGLAPLPGNEFYFANDTFPPTGGIDDLVEIDLQARPYQTVHFTGIHTHPSR